MVIVSHVDSVNGLDTLLLAKASEKKIMEYLRVIENSGSDVNPVECVDDRNVLSDLYREYRERAREITVPCILSV